MINMDDIKGLNKYRGRKMIIYDIDNTLLDVRERYWRSLEEIGEDPLKGVDKLRGYSRKKFWEIFLSEKYLHLDKPSKKVIDEVNRKYEDGYGIILLTGRPESMRKATENQLKKFGVKYHLLIMRPNGNRDPDYIYKIEIIKKLLENDMDIIEYHEDDIKTIERVKKLFPSIKVFRHDVSRERFFFYNE